MFLYLVYVSSNPTVCVSRVLLPAYVASAASSAGPSSTLIVALESVADFLRSQAVGLPAAERQVRARALRLTAPLS